MSSLIYRWHVGVIGSEGRRTAACAHSADAAVAWLRNRMTEMRDALKRAGEDDAAGELDRQLTKLWKLAEEHASNVINLRAAVGDEVYLIERQIILANVVHSSCVYRTIDGWNAAARWDHGGHPWDVWPAVPYSDVS